QHYHSQTDQYEYRKVRSPIEQLRDHPGRKQSEKRKPESVYKPGAEIVVFALKARCAQKASDHSSSSLLLNWIAISAPGSVRFNSWAAVFSSLSISLCALIRAEISPIVLSFASRFWLSVSRRAFSIAMAARSIMAATISNSSWSHLRLSTD